MPLEEGDFCEAVVGTRLGPTWKMADGKVCARACVLAKGYQDPDLKDGSVGASGRVSRRCSHLRVKHLGAIEKWKIWSLHTKSASPRADGSVVAFF